MLHTNRTPCHNLHPVTVPAMAFTASLQILTFLSLKLLPQCPTFPFPNHSTSLFSSFSTSSRPPRCRLTLSRTPIAASLKENLGRLGKTWNDVTSLNSLVVQDYYHLVNSVNSFEPQLQWLTDDQLTAKIAEFWRRLGLGETLADIQAEAFAVVREAAKRKLGMHHFDVQVILC